MSVFGQLKELLGNIPGHNVKAYVSTQYTAARRELSRGLRACRYYSGRPKLSSKQTAATIITTITAATIKPDML